MSETVTMRHQSWGTTEVTDPDRDLMRVYEASGWERVSREECERDDSPELPPVA